MTASGTIAALATRLLCVFALVLVSFAHRAPAANAGDLPDLSAYTLPDGTVLSICIGGRSGDDGDQDTSGACEFCRIAGAVALPAAPADFERCGVWGHVLPPLPRELRVAGAAYPPAAPPRGPPHAFI
ncbi:hypothetical protein [Oricola sp.]|uniref:hypothetical protein n=1 Tax=Oricola sp. TaxID=1979950 RepID=UPI003BACAC88